MKLAGLTDQLRVRYEPWGEPGTIRRPAVRGGVWVVFDRWGPLQATEIGPAAPLDPADFTILTEGGEPR